MFSNCLYEPSCEAIELLLHDVVSVVTNIFHGSFPRFSVVACAAYEAIVFLHKYDTYVLIGIFTSM